MGRKPKEKTQAGLVDTQSEKSERLTALKVAMAQIDKQFGAGSIIRLGQSPVNTNISVISTGALSLDVALGVGGLPRGRVVEIYGPEASGKTTVALQVVAEAQKHGGVAAFIDAEHALDVGRAQNIGVNVDELLLSQPDNGEQALEIADTLIRSGGVDVVVIDSVAALVPKSELEGEMGDSVMGLQARLMSQALRKLTGALNKSNCMLIFTNQLREKIGVMFGNPEVTTGGRALKFYASVRIDMRKIGNIQEGDEIIGSRHRAKVVKNKVAPPFKAAEFDILNQGGISKLGTLLDVAVDKNIIDKSGAFLKFQTRMLGQGREAARIFLAENPEIVSEIEKAVYQAVNIPQPI